MARSAGNFATEIAVAAFQRKGLLEGVDLMALLEFLDSKLIPAMKEYNYKVSVVPFDLILGMAGAHSSLLNFLEKLLKKKMFHYINLF